MRPLVSILIPAYNAAESIAETIESSLTQTWPRTEIIIVDDGSTDDTVALARRFASRSVAVVTQRNQGAAAARNAAFERCQGEYIQWLDADDVLAPDKIERQMRARTAGCTEGTLLSSEWGYFIYRRHHAEFTPTPLWCDLSPGEWLFRKMGENLHMQTATWLVSRKLSDAAGPWDTRLVVDDDGEYFCRVLRASDGVRFVPQARVFYRRPRVSGVSYIGRSDAKMEAQFLSMRLHIGYLLSLEDSPRTRCACVNYLQTWLPTFHPARPDIVREAEQLATSLGGQLAAPRLSWKYDWIRRLLGWNVARTAEMKLRQLKWNLVRAWDCGLLRLERQRSR